MMNHTKKLHGLVVIPAYNEEQSIAKVVHQAQAYLPVLVVDDGSVDDTVKIARSAGAQVVQIATNGGKGAALRKGFQVAVENKYDFVITLDGDGQHDPEEIPKFIKHFSIWHSDLVIGQRDFHRMPIVRRISNTLSQVIFSWAVGRKIPDNQSGYRLISAHLMEALLVSDENGFEFEVEMIVKCLIGNFRMRWIPIRTIYGEEKSHIHPIHHVVKFLQISFRTHTIMKKAFRYS